MLDALVHLSLTSYWHQLFVQFFMYRETEESDDESETETETDRESDTIGEGNGYGTTV